uniref:Uncharacterized protein n=1 Tax=Monopterus albus TaxID=43700 RepID=A0A3Q3QY10_MONAL
MERNIGDQLNKAFEAYRQVSIEKDNAKKELQKMVTTKSFLELCVKFAKQYSTNNKSQSSFHCQVYQNRFCILLTEGVLALVLCFYNSNLLCFLLI